MRNKVQRGIDINQGEFNARKTRSIIKPVTNNRFNDISDNIPRSLVSAGQNILIKISNAILTKWIKTKALFMCNANVLPFLTFNYFMYRVLFRKRFCINPLRYHICWQRHCVKISAHKFENSIFIKYIVWNIDILSYTIKMILPEAAINVGIRSSNN